MSWTSLQDITDRWVGSGAPTDDVLVEALIADAEAVVLSEYPRIQERVDDETLPLGTLVMVISRMVTRVLRNPENLTYWQMNTGPFGQGKNYGADGNTDIWLTDRERDLLAPKRRGKAFEINLGYDARSPHTLSDFAPHTLSDF